MDDNLEIASLVEQTYSDVLLEFFRLQQLQEESSQVSLPEILLRIYMLSQSKRLDTN